MKKSLFFLSFALAIASAPVLFAQDAGANTATAPVSPSTSDGSGNDGAAGEGSGQHAGKWRQAFAQLGLSDAQKQQIQQIRTSTQPGKERRQQIMAVLTPDQKQKLRSMFQQNHEQQDGQ